MRWDGRYQDGFGQFGLGVRGIIVGNGGAVEGGGVGKARNERIMAMQDRAMGRRTCHRRRIEGETAAGGDAGPGDMWVPMPRPKCGKQTRTGLRGRKISFSIHVREDLEDGSATEPEIAVHIRV